ncbi:MAG: hypothetical protein KME16_17100 [Scytolyngbya sp. HA4215-MV1]|jgi:hypothetical protein|nr:hypothetical protein [Scytolyngbya sp. HA4215-MV1]
MLVFLYSDLEHLKDRDLYYVSDREIREGTIIIMILPLLNLLELCNLPYQIRGEEWVSVRVKTDMISRCFPIQQQSATVCPNHQATNRQSVGVGSLSSYKGSHDH